MKRGYILTTAKHNIFFETEKRRNDATAGAIIDKLGELHKLTPELIQRAKTDRATLDDLKKRLTLCSLEEEKNDRILLYYAGAPWISCHKSEILQATI